MRLNFLTIAISMHYFFPYERNSSWKGQLGMEDRTVVAYGCRKTEKQANVVAYGRLPSPDRVSKDLFTSIWYISLNANKAYVIALYVCNSGFTHTNNINSNQHVIKLSLNP